MSKPQDDEPLLDGLTIVFVVLASFSGIALSMIHGTERLTAVLVDGGYLLVAIVPLVVCTVMVAAYVQRLIDPSVIENWLGGDSGMRGMVVATLAGALTPGGPFAAFPLVVGLFHSGASAPVCISYLTAWSVLGLQRVLVWEVPLMGPEFTILRLLVSLPLPVLAGILATFLFERSHRKA